MVALKNWTEFLRCANCALAGVARLTQANDSAAAFAAAIAINDMPVGFIAVSSEYGDTFFCEACDRAAA
jgi:hypothetical protein